MQTGQQAFNQDTKGTTISISMVLYITFSNWVNLFLKIHFPFLFSFFTSLLTSFFLPSPSLYLPPSYLFLTCFILTDQHLVCKGSSNERELSAGTVENMSNETHDNLECSQSRDPHWIPLPLSVKQLPRHRQWPQRGKLFCLWKKSNRPFS